MDFRQLEVFRAIMIAKTVSGAAETLNLSQPAVSRILKLMEDRVGTFLFERLKGRLVPTPEAVQIFSEVDLIYKKMESLQVSIQQILTGDNATFRIGATPSLGHGVLPKLIGEMVQEINGFNADISIITAEQVIDFILFNRIEAALTLFPVKHPSINVTHCGTGELVAVLPVSHPLAQHNVLNMAQLDKVPLVCHKQGTPHGNIITEAFSNAGIKQNVRSYVNNVASAYALVRAGVGIALLDEFSSISESPQNISLRRIEEKYLFNVYLCRNEAIPVSHSLIECEKKLIATINNGNHSL